MKRPNLEMRAMDAMRENCLLIEALEAMKLILGAGEPLVGRMVYFDTLSKDYVRVLKIKRDPNCPVCSDHPTQTGLIDYEAFCGLGGTVYSPEIGEAGR